MLRKDSAPRYLKIKDTARVNPRSFIADAKAGVAIVIPCTANLQALRFPFTLQVEPSHENGLDVSSVALVLQIRAIDKKRLRKKIGRVERSILIKLDIMMRNLLGLQ